MSTKKSRDFLDKELFVERGIVTFRSLSRALEIHVNDAKNELQYYYDAVRDGDAPPVPTYLVSGEVAALTVSRHSESQQSMSAMDVEPEFEQDQEEEDVVYQSKLLLVAAHMLDESMSRFSRVHSVHIYSLSPSRFRDPGLVCTPSFKVHQADAKGGPEFFSAVGKITGSHVKLRDRAANESVASSSRTILNATTKMAPVPAGPTKTEHQTKGKVLFPDAKQKTVTTTPPQRAESRENPKRTGKLDWSKAKTKTKEKEPASEKSREGMKPKPEPVSPAATMDSPTSTQTGLEPAKPSVLKSEASGTASGYVQKRGMERNPFVDTYQESESESSSVKAKPSTVTGSSVRKGVVYSDGDDDDEVRMVGQRRRKRKGAVTSDSETSLRAMMDIDDEHVDHVSRAHKILPQPEESEESERESHEAETFPPGTTEDEESDHVPVVPKTRKPRKIVPVGRNGLKKRRVIKSRMTTDVKGYMQTEDYSSYESIDEGEAEEIKPKKKGKGKETKRASELVDKDEDVKPKVVARKESIGKLKVKPPPKSRGGGPKRGGLLNFFGPERGKN